MYYRSKEDISSSAEQLNSMGNWFLSNIQLPDLATHRNGESNSAIVEEISSFSVSWDEMVAQYRH